MSSLTEKGSIKYTVEGSWKNHSEYGHAKIDDQDDRLVEVSIYSFKTTQAAKTFVLPLKSFATNQFVNTVYFVDEGVRGLGAKVITERVSFDMVSFVEHGIYVMQQKFPTKENIWWNFSGTRFLKVFGGLTTIIATILVKEKGHYDFPPLKQVGAVSISSDGSPKLAELTDLYWRRADHSLKISDLAETMEYFITEGAINMNAQLPWEVKMKRLDVPSGVIGFIAKCKAWNTGSRVPIEWLLDSCALWKNVVIVDWIDRLSNLVGSWRQNKPHLLAALDVVLAKKLNHKPWMFYLPTKGRTHIVLQDHLKIIKDAESKVQKSGKLFKEYQFHNICKFYRHMHKHYNKPSDLEENKFVPSEICVEVEKYFTEVGGLLNSLREVLESVICLDPKFAHQRVWEQVLSS